MDGSNDMVEPERLPLVVTALDHPLRLRVIASLLEGRRYVSALARELGISRPLLYMHLDRLEKAGLVTASLELGADGKAVKWYELRPFDLHITPEAVARAVTAGPADQTDQTGKEK
jgi:DNA-binding transcriptional ArsR family regulator